MSTAELLLELFVEEIPHGELFGGRDRLRDAIVAGLEELGVAHGAVRAFATPRRLVVTVADVEAAVPAREVVETGPSIKAPERAVAGFARGKKVELADLIQVPGKKGKLVWAVRKQLGGDPTAGRLPALLRSAIEGLHWGKNMRWGSSSFRFVRPIQGLVALFGGALVPFSVAGVAAGTTSLGHRNAADRSFEVTDFASLEAGLRARHVVLDSAEREQTIRSQLAAAGITDPSDALISKIVGVTEWPTVVRGTFDPAYLELPLALRAKILGHHLMFFPLPGEAAFLGVSNLPVEDFSAVRRGMEWVVAARLADGAFFWREDAKTRLEERLPRLADVVYLRGMGSVLARAERIGEHAARLAPLVGADATAAARAGLLCKADLVTQVVNEFAELQGWVGAHYAARDGEPAEVAAALAEHYRPVGREPIPAAAVSQAVALAERIDTIVTCTAGGKKARGDRDPYGLRRAAIGILRLLLEGGHALELSALFGEAWTDDLAGFFSTRLRGLMAERFPTDHVDAVMAAGRWEQPLDVQARLAALAAADVAVLAVPFKRAHNLARKNDKQPYAPEALSTEQGRAVAALLDQLRGAVRAALDSGDYAAALSAMSDLKPVVDRFFDDVLVMAEDPAVRSARLGLLGALSETFVDLADFTRIHTA